MRRLEVRQCIDQLSDTEILKITVLDLPAEPTTPFCLLEWLMLRQAHTMNLRFQNWNELKRLELKRKTAAHFFAYCFWSEKIRPTKWCYAGSKLGEHRVRRRSFTVSQHSTGTNGERNVIEKHEIDFWFKGPPRIMPLLAFFAVCRQWFTLKFWDRPHSSAVTIVRFEKYLSGS